MTVSAIAAVLDDDRTRGAERLVMIVLADHANERLQCWPGINRIARLANLSVDHTKRTIRSLVDQGLIERRINQGPLMPDQQANLRSNFYYLSMLEGLVRVDEEGGTITRERGGQSRGRGGDNHASDRGQKSPLTVIEPPAEPSVEPSSVIRSDDARGDVAHQTDRPTDSLFTDPPATRSSKRPTVNPMAKATFDQWWSTWPRKTGKDAALKAWLEAAAAAEPSIAQLTAAQGHMLESLALWHERWGQPLETKFIAHPATFIRQKWRGFEDGPDPDRWPGPNQTEWGPAEDPELDRLAAEAAARRAEVDRKNRERMEYQDRFGGQP